MDEDGKEVAIYWKNGEPVILPGGCRANAIAVSGNDVYVTGIDRNAEGANIIVYWKNGKAVRLTDGKEASGAGASVITVAGNDVYIAGYLDGKATYWKNEKPVGLNDIIGGITGMVVR